MEICNTILTKTTTTTTNAADEVHDKRPNQVNERNKIQALHR